MTIVAIPFDETHLEPPLLTTLFPDDSLADRKQAISTLFSLAAYKRFDGCDNMSSADARRIQ